MNIESVLKFINEETPSHAKELWSAIDLLSGTLENTKCAIDGTIGKLASNRDFDKAKEYMEMSQQLASVMDELNKYIKKYGLEEDIKGEVIEDEEDNEDDNQNPTNKINYEKYRVDENVAYNIYTDFTYKKPAAFAINGKKYYARKWQDLFIKTCEILVELNSEKFRAFTNDDMIQGRTRKYFSFDGRDIKKPKKIKGTNVFVETNLSANNIRNIIVNMLERYNIPKSQYQIYLSKDLSALHIDDNSSTRKSEKVEDTDEDYHIQKDDVLDIHEENKSNNNSVYQNNPMDFRFSKDTSTQQSIPEYNNLNQRMGTPSHIEYLKMADGDKRRHRARCVEYDKKKEVCMCVKSPYFTMRCGGASHCKYYSEHGEEDMRLSISSTIQNLQSDIICNDKVYVVSANIQKQHKCIKCQGKTEYEMIPVVYNHNGEIVRNKLAVYKCILCGRKQLLDSLYKNYTNKKDIADISIDFICLDN